MIDQMVVWKEEVFEGFYIWREGGHVINTTKQYLQEGIILWMCICKIIPGDQICDGANCDLDGWG